MTALLILLISLTLLLWAAHHLVIGSSGIAHHMHLPPLMIGLTIVALGTSAPEIMVAITAALDGHTSLAISNAIGSNIANIGLVLGITILLRPPQLQTSLLRREYPLLFIVMVFTYSLMVDGEIGIIDGCLMLLGTIGLIGYFAYLLKQSNAQHIHHEFQEAIKAKRHLSHNILSFILGIVLLPISTHYLIDSAVQIAEWLNVSQTVIGLSIIAVGTSLPEIATSVVAALREESDIAIGNILGSNILNLIVVLMFPGLINPGPISPELLWRDIPVMFIITFILLLMNYRHKQQITRWQGGMLLLIYCGYILSLW